MNINNATLYLSHRLFSQFFVSLLLVWLGILLIPQKGHAQNCPIETPIRFPVNVDSTVYEFQIFDVINNTLGSSGQGVCGVSIDFVHNSVGNFELWLVSPAGQRVQLIGPNATAAPPTLFGRWRVNFVPCNITAQPDPGFQSQWNNSTNPFGASSYRGSYYPFRGCLADFNRGPVNGVWKLILLTNPTSTDILGRLNALNIQLCDRRGQKCCFAEAGDLAPRTVAVCEGDEDLNLRPSPIFSAPKADSTRYRYTYAIGRGVTLFKFDSLADLRSLSPGNYQVCGLSYLRRDSAKLRPLISTNLRLDTLRERLKLESAPFCGEMTPVCINVNIAPRTDSTVLPLRNICEGDSLVVNGRVLKQTGRYRINFANPLRCDSLVIVNLSVNSTKRVNANQTICFGDSLRFGTRILKTAGIFTEKLEARSGCDSIVTLNLSVRSAPRQTDTTIAICPGRTARFGGRTFSTAGVFNVPLKNANLCDSIVRVTVEIIQVNPIIRASDSTLTCTRRSVTLDGSLSEPRGAVIYRWEDSNGNPIGQDSAQFLVTRAGTYFLQAITRRGLCARRVRIDIRSDTLKPIPIIGDLNKLDCSRKTVTLSMAGSQNLLQPRFKWSTIDGKIEGSDTLVTATVSRGGNYSVRITNGRNGCTETAFPSVQQDTLKPVANAGGGGLLTCNQPNLRLDGTGSSTGPDYDYFWTGNANQVIGNPNSLQPEITQPGVYQLRVLDTNNGCSALDTVTVEADSARISVRIDPPGSFNCQIKSLTLRSRVQTNGRPVAINWSALNGGILTGPLNQANVDINRPGTYVVEATDQISGCRVNASVQIRDTSSAIKVVIVKPNDLNCFEPGVEVDATGSSTGRGLVYQWVSLNGGRIEGPSNQLKLKVVSQGNFKLIIRDTLTQCRDSAVVTVNNDATYPKSDVDIALDILTCQRTRLRINGLNSSGGADYEYKWTGPCIIGSSSTPIATVSCAGNYVLEVRNKTNGCSSRDSATILSNQIKPRLLASEPQVIDCTHPTPTLSAKLDSAGAQFISIRWTGPGIVGVDTTLDIKVNKPGQYLARAVNRQNGCSSEAPIDVTIDTATITANAGLDSTLTCIHTQRLLGGTGNSSSERIIYRWTTRDGLFEGRSDTSLQAIGIKPGIYQLEVKDTVNGCFARDSVVLIDQQKGPRVNIVQPLQLSCARTSIQLDARNSEQGPSIRYAWRSTCPLSDSSSLVQQVTCEGRYILRGFNANTGCQSLDTILVQKDPETPRAVINANTADINCTAGVAILSARGSRGGTLRWIRDGQIVGTDSTLQVREAGIYGLVIDNTRLGCKDSTSVVVSKSCKPTASLTGPTILSCKQEVIRLDGSASTFNPAIRYRWIAPGPGCIATDSTLPSVTVRCPGVYQLIVQNIVANESDTAVITLRENKNLPIANAGTGDTLSCSQPNANLNGSSSSQGPNIQYSWLDDQGNIISRNNQVNVSTPGTYALEVRDTSSGCLAQDQVTIAKDQSFPAIAFSRPQQPCNQDTFVFRTAITPTNAPYRFSWTGPAIVRNADSLNVVLRGPGQYIFEVINTQNNCTVKDTVEITAAANCAPCLSASTAPAKITCTVSQVRLPANLCRPCRTCSVNWTTSNGRFVSRTDTLQPLVDRAGDYLLTVTDSVGISTTLNVQVLEDQEPPQQPRVRDGNLTCSILQLPLPIPDSTEGNQVRFRWQTNNGVITTGPIRNTFFANAVGNYSLITTNVNNGCQSELNIRIGKDSIPPNANAGRDLELDCLSQRLTLNGNQSSLGPGISYAWEAINGGRIVSGSNSLNPVINAMGQYVIIVRDARNDCTARDTMRVLPNSDRPAIQLIPDAALNCRDTALTLLGNAPATGNYSFNWYALSEKGDTLITTRSRDLRVRKAGNYIFEITDLRNGCNSSTRTTVKIDTIRPVIDAGVGDTLNCRETSIPLKPSVFTGHAGLRFKWTNRPGSSISNDTLLAARALNPGMYFLTATDPLNFCSAVDSVRIFADNNLVQISLRRDTILNCSPRQIQLQAVVSPISNNLQYRWTTIGGRIAQGNTQLDPQIDRPGIYTLEVTNPSNGCRSQAQIEVKDQTLRPKASIGGKNILTCREPVIALQGKNSVSPFNRPLRYFWLPLETNGRLQGSPANDSALVSAAGAYRLIVTDPLTGCQDSTQINIRADIDQPKVSISPPGSINCQQDTVRLDAGNSTSGPNIRYAWFGPDGQALPDTTRFANVTQLGTYRLRITNSFSACSASDSVTVVRDTTAPRPRIRALDVFDCNITVIDLEAGGSQGSNLQYRWSTANGRIIGSSNGAIIKAGTAGTYRLELTDGKNGCRARDSIVIDNAVQGIQDVRFSLKQPGCGPGKRGELRIDAIQGGRTPYNISLNNQAIGPNNTFGNLGPGEYTLRISYPGGCGWSQKITLNAPQAPALELGPNREIKLGDSVLVKPIRISDSIALYQWASPLDLKRPNDTLQLVRPFKNTSLELLVIAENGCRTSDFVLITVLQNLPVYVPTVFSPNGDNVNDKLTLFATKQIKKVLILRVYDRWGNQLFEQRDFQPNDPNQGWDGTYRGKMMNPGAYVYYAEIELPDGNREMIKGEAGLMR
jgi:gliding motility-associated-like protein